MFYKPVINKDGHRPIENGDYLAPDSMPVSEEVGNQLVASTEGLYVGVLNATPVKIYVDSAVGVDDALNGSELLPVKTLDYALEQLNVRDLSGQGLARIGAVYWVMLKAGQTFALTKSVELNGVKIIVGFYGDTRGDWNTEINNTTLDVLSDINRPVINNVIQVNTQTGNFEASRFYTKNRTWNSSIEFHGCKINIGETSSTNLGVVDFIDGLDLFLVGTVVNKTGLSPTGLLAVRADTQVTFRQFASQFQIIDRLINKAQGQDGITFADLEARSLFIKFYLGLGGANYRWENLLYNPQALNSSNASGLLNLLWEDSISQSSGSSNTTPSYPLMSELNYGIAKYVTNLRRDQQGRVINILGGRLI